MKTAVIAGATGLVGRELLNQMLSGQQYSRVIALTRRDFPVSHPRLEKIITDFSDLETALENIRPDVVFCCLGTTMAVAGSREKFYEVDFQFPLSLARVTRAMGASQYLLVSALGADAKSRIYYNRVKGEVEKAIAEVGFATLHIFRPSLLLGRRSEKRAGEDAAKTFYRIFGFLIPRKYGAVQGSAVARAMLASALETRTGIVVHESLEIQQYS